MTPKERANRIANGHHDYPSGSAKCGCDGNKAYTDPDCIEKEEQRKLFDQIIIKEKQELIDILELIPLSHRNRCERFKWLKIHESCKFSCAALNNKECPPKPDCNCHLVKILDKLNQLLTEVATIKQNMENKQRNGK